MGILSVSEARRSRNLDCSHYAQLWGAKTCQKAVMGCSKD